MLYCAVGVASEDTSSRRLLVKQSYPLKTGGEQSCESARKKAMEEVSRIITSDGTVIRTLVDGGTQVATHQFSPAPIIYTGPVPGFSPENYFYFVGIWTSLPDFVRDPASSTDCFRRLLKTCSRVTSASSALGVLNDYVLYKSTHSLTHSLTH